MSQHDYSIANQTGLEFRADMNNALAAIVTDNSGSTEPATTFPGMVWRDTSVSPSVLKKRNDANDAWVTILTAAGEAISGASTASAQRTALGLGSAATLTAGTSAGNLVQLNGTGQLPAVDGSLLTGIANNSPSLFYKVDSTTVVFTKTGNGTATIKAGTQVYVNGTVVTFATDTSITMPTLTAGTDYVVWVKDDSTIQAGTSFVSPPEAGNWRLIGGFHYANGSNAPAQAGGDITPQINKYSFWDLKFRPACGDPRGMTLVAGSFWADIYLLGVDHPTNGTSKYNVSIADGGAPPKIPVKFGGNGTSSYPNLTWFVASEVMRAYGKRLPTYDEFAALAYGTTEATSSGGSDVPTTGVSGTGATNAWNEFTSRWGVMQATGCMWIWGGEFGGGAAGASWTANTGGRGSTYQMENAVYFGGHWGNPTEAGSRSSAWNLSPTNSNNGFGARGVCDHVVLI